MKREVVIVGGGIVGLCVAYYLSRAGISDVVVLERGKIADEASYNNMGGLWPNIMSRPDITKPFADWSLLLYEEMTKEGFRFEFRRNGVLEVLSDNADDEEKRVEERRAKGYNAKFLSPSEIEKIEPNIARNFVGGIFCPNDANASSFLLAKELHTYLTKKDISIMEGAEVNDFQVESNKIREIETSKGSFSAKFVVNTAGPWSSFIGNMLGISIPVQPAKGYMCETEPVEKLIHAAVTNNNIVVTQRPAGQIRMGGIVEFAGFNRTFDKIKKQMILDSASSILYALAKLPIADERIGFRPYADDGLPIIGYSKQISNMILATGHFRRGFELASGTGKVVAELILDGKTSEDIEFASPKRFDL
ncbi:MAG: FAD-binding oxidoreductase [Thaumarchaeota archaeon]|nr:FAD-binding oxidoreductase [Nitrososphaerota archaeon]